jgi:hypothetical protein
MMSEVLALFHIEDVSFSAERKPPYSVSAYCVGNIAMQESSNFLHSNILRATVSEVRPRSARVTFDNESYQLDTACEWCKR